MSPYVFMRQFRTASSEGYAIMEHDLRIGRVDLHFATEKVYATIVLEREMTENEVAAIIDEIDNNLVASATVKREDLNVWVYTGTEMGFFTDEEPYLDGEEPELEDDLDEEDELVDDEDLDEEDLDEDDLDDEDLDEDEEDLR
ncbi:MAG: hypothetical protein J0I20_10960 [Chloroflexi bacterium]|nr:hypothetical protein [Chloroflexota bacterium]OJV94403.1 MAG: hypothetical protein BGO39_21830 [Chloroflexi bacterium 54-19]